MAPTSSRLESGATSAIVERAALFIFVPALLSISPDWPHWIAMLFPRYWIDKQIWQVSVMGEALSCCGN